MSDAIFDGSNVPIEYRAVFEQLCAAFGPPFQVWRRTESLGRSLTAAVLNPETGVAVFVPIRTQDRLRSVSLGADVIDRIREHFASAASDDLTI